MARLCWCPPRFGWVKFNVNGVAIEDEAVCGGVLRDTDEVARALFLGAITAKDVMAAETRAIIPALEVLLAMGWGGKGYLIIENGSNEVFNWLRNKMRRPWKLQSIFMEIDRCMDRVSFVSFSKAEKNGSRMATALAIASIKRFVMFKAW